ncbi:MAG: DUF433 domain-containing protein [bacterium]
MDTYQDRIEINPKILLGKPVFKGTRIPVYVVLDLLAEGETTESIVQYYPDLKTEDIKAAIYFASDAARHIAEIELEALDRNDETFQRFQKMSKMVTSSLSQRIFSLRGTTPILPVNY